MAELGDGVMPTGERYKDCPYGLKAFAYTFPSLQCDIRACGGVKKLKKFEEVCESCEKYVINRQRKDWEDVDRPV